MSFTIHPRLNHPQAGYYWSQNYCFDDPAHGLVAEPLLNDVTAAIKELFSCYGIESPPFITIEFIDSEPDEEWEAEYGKSIVCALDYERESSDGSVYMINVLEPPDMRAPFAVANMLGAFNKATLCPMLMRYFDNPPEYMVARISVSDGSESLAPPA